MMKLGVALACLLSTAAAAQTVMDQSDKAISAADMRVLREAMKARLLDPYGAQIESLKIVVPGRICGRVNAKNKLGGFLGFRVFGLDLNTGALSIEPDGETEGKGQDQLNAEIGDLYGIKAACSTGRAP